jgi:hypothetical protein
MSREAWNRKFVLRLWIHVSFYSVRSPLILALTSHHEGVKMNKVWVTSRSDRRYLLLTVGWAPKLCWTWWDVLLYHVPSQWIFIEWWIFVKFWFNHLATAGFSVLLFFNSQPPVCYVNVTAWPRCGCQHHVMLVPKVLYGNRHSKNVSLLLKLLALECKTTRQSPEIWNWITQIVDTPTICVWSIASWDVKLNNVDCRYTHYLYMKHWILICEVE